jgi:hypothetical protein
MYFSYVSQFAFHIPVLMLIQEDVSPKQYVEHLITKITRNGPRALKRPDPLGLKCDTITSPRRLVTTFLTSNST